MPVLILHGTPDKATMASGSQFFHTTAGSHDKTPRMTCSTTWTREKVMADVRQWIEQRLAARADI
jgi:alpha-beta hydrolase superfamily lysophospholipase